MKWRTISEDGNFITIRKFGGDFGIKDRTVKKKEIKGLALDTETTGFNSNGDEIIEIGIRNFTFDSEDGQIISITDSYSALQQPKLPLRKEIIAITGLTDNDLQGKKIEWEKVNDMIKNAQLVIAHNAAFDRPFVDRVCQASRDKLWGCTSEQIKWSEKYGFSSKKLECLSYYHGFFTDAHRALNDVDAMLCVLAHPFESNPYLGDVLDDLRIKRFKVVAEGTPFNSKDILKSRGYSWDAVKKAWWIIIPESDRQAEIIFLEKEIYMNRFPGKAFPIKTNEMFKENV